ncbi:MAG: hypothetical protein ACFFCS_16785 [Candidatus Hodarchaeota archaeon]
MLEDFCNSLPDNAQVAIGIRLIKLILPVWEDYMVKHPEQLKRANELIKKENYVQGGAHKIEIDLPRLALEEVETSLGSGASLGENKRLKSYMATFMEPLTNSSWEDMLPDSIQLVFTSVWNVITFLIFRRVTESNETHIYVAINQACDVILREKLLSKVELEEILLEFESMLDSGVKYPVGFDDKEDNNEEDDSSSGARCPSCGLRGMYAADGSYEFTKMVCPSCGYEEWMDEWQVDDLYR